MSQFPTSRGATKTRHDDMKRERNVRLHYGAAFCNIPHVDDLATHIARPSRDSTLTALCQLTAIRMGGQRAMISLIDSERQYILAEATCDLSLRPEAPGNAQNALWLGNVSIPRSLGLGENVLDPNLENNILVIEDLQADGRSCFQGHAQEPLDMRFYAGVALVSPDGTIVGTLSIFDNKSHNGFTSDQIALLKDLASTTVDYLNTYTIRDQYSRGERFTRGLVSFAEGATALLPFQQSEQHDPSIIPRTSLNSSSTTEKEFKPAEESDTMEVDDPVPGNSSFATPGTATPRSTRHRAIRALQDSILPVDSKAMFSRAANVMMASSDLDGVLILDASVAANGGQRRAHTMSRTSNGTDSPSESYQSRTSSEGESSNSTEGNSRSKSSSSSKTCQLLGVATPKEKENTEYGTMLESDLSRMLREYPHGKIFTFAANGTALSSTDDTSSSPHIPEQLPPRAAYSKRPTRNWSKRCSETIQEMFPKAYSVAFIPFWDFERSRWFAGCLCWSNDPYRLLSPSVDLTYFKIFSHSIMRELSRLDAMTLSQAKSTFVASISHELRSPLHGILGTLEFFKDTPLDSFQASMLNSLHGCGITLLDTINHVMDYAKISESKKSISSKRIKSENTVRLSSKPRKSGRRKDPAFDMGIATEEVVEAVFSGSSYIPITAKRIEEASSNTENELTHYPKRRARFIILEVAQEDDWLFSFPIGSWRRIVMNLFGNAVKYTESGYIHVSLRSGKPTENSNAPSSITLTITDTGLGMSPSFLANRIFEPFCQENPHAPGIGLGLSIVRQILDMSGGKIEVSSQPSIGSKMTVKLALTRPEPSESFTVERKQLESLLPRLQGRKIYILCKKTAGSESTGDTDGAQTDEGYLRFINALVNTLESCLKMDILRTTDWEPHDADLVICPELSFDYLDAIRRRRTRGVRAPVVIFVGMDALEAATLRSDVRVTNKESVVEIMTQPCGPYKLAVVLNRCLDRYDHPDENVQPAEMLSPLSRAVSPGAQNSSYPTPRPGSMQSSSGHLAVRPAEHPAKSPVASPTLQPTTSPRQELDSDVSHLLIVDDNVLNRRLLVAFMKKNSLQFQEASNGLEALQAYQAGPRNFRAILMDMSMPVMDGMTATRAIREHERDNNLPRSYIIALTGLASSSAKLEAWSSGIDHYMTKPVNYKELKELLESEEAQKRESQKGAGTSDART